MTRTGIPYNNMIEMIRVSSETDGCEDCGFRIERDDSRVFGANWRRAELSINCSDRCKSLADKAVEVLQSKYDVVWP